MFLVSLFVVIVCVQSLLLALVPTRFGLRVAASALFVVAAASSYFASAYGAIMNQDMLRNAIETDPAEVGGLMSFDLVAHVVLLGVLPAVLIWRVALPSSTWRRQLRRRLVFIGSILTSSIVGEVDVEIIENNVVVTVRRCDESYFGPVSMVTV